MYVYYWLSLFVSVTSVLYMPLSEAGADKYVVGVHGAGFFSAFSGVLNHLSYCERNNKTPVVYWGNNARYYNPRGFNGSYNAWEYYFEPVSGLSYVSGDVVHDGYYADSMEFVYDRIDTAKREQAHSLISKYIRLNSIVQHKVDSFYQARMAGKKTIGIHLRGTDKGSEEKLVSAQQIAEIALRYADGNTQFLIATDEQRLLDQLVGLLRNYRVVYYDCYRSTNHVALHMRKPKPPICQLGEDVLVEVSLLAQCDLLVHTLSNVSTACLYFSPTMPHVTVR